MKTAARVIAIVAVAAALLCVAESFRAGFLTAHFGEFTPADPEVRAAKLAEPLTAYDIIFFVPGALGAIGAAFGVAGTAVARRRKRLAGGLFVAAAVFSIFTFVGVIATLLFIVCAVMAFHASSRPPDAVQPVPIPRRPAAVLTVSLCACILALIVSLVYLCFGSFQAITYHSAQTAPAAQGLYRSLYHAGLYTLTSGILGTAGGIVGIVSLRFSGKKKRLAAGIMVAVSGVCGIALLYGTLTVLLALASLYLFWPEKKPSEPDADSSAMPDSQQIQSVSPDDNPTDGIPQA